MGKTYDSIDERLAGFIAEQQVFFVATGPLAAEGHLNLSPKGLDTFRVLGPRRVAYLDLTGSGVETIAHLRENGRIVLMFCALTGPPKILRLHGRGRVMEPGDERFDARAAEFPKLPGIRSIIEIDVERISDSCGYGVPSYRYEGERSALPEWARKKAADELEAYRAEHNRKSIDGLPGLTNS